jgi:hypothetical protein
MTSDQEPTRPERIGRGVWRGIYSSMVDHPDFHLLTPHERLVLFVCRLGSQNTAASIFRYYREPLMVQTGLAAAELETALAGLEKKPSARAPWIIRDDAVVWIRNGLKHDPTYSVQNRNHRLSLLRAVAALPRTPTVRKFRRYYKLPIGMGDGIGQGIGDGTTGAMARKTPTPTPNTTPTPTPKGAEAAPPARPLGEGGAPAPSSNGTAREPTTEERHRARERIAEEVRAHEPNPALVEAVIGARFQHWVRDFRWGRPEALALAAPIGGSEAQP